MIGLHYLAVFLAMIVTDFVWAQYTRAVADHRINKGGLMAIGIITIGAYVTTSYVANPWMLLPAAAGAYVGTASSVWWEKRKKA
jgi:hypothetical protein